MAVWKRSVKRFAVKIHDVDHPPPHCHVFVNGKDLKVTIETLMVLNPPPNALPGQLRAGLKSLQSEMLASWEKVRVPDLASKSNTTRKRK